MSDMTAEERAEDDADALEFYQRHYRAVEELVGGVEIRREGNTATAIGLRARVEEAITAARNAALEEAAQATCIWCQMHWTLDADGYHHRPDGEEHLCDFKTTQCKAQAIQNLKNEQA